MRGRIHLDSSWWFQAEEPLPHFKTLYQAAWRDRRVKMTYLRTFEPRGELRVEHLVDPYGLVAKASEWYIVASRGERMQVYRIAQVLDLQVTDEEFIRPWDFDLRAFWQTWCAGYERSHISYSATLRIAPDLVREIPRLFGRRKAEEVPRAAPDVERWVTLTLTFEHLEGARDRLLGLGAAVEVLEPRALRLSLAEYAAQIAALYGSRAGSAS